MSNRRANGNWGKAAANPSVDVPQMNPEEGNDGAQWEVYNKKSKNRGEGSNSKAAWQPQTQKAWGQPSGTGRGGNAWSSQSNADFRRPSAAGRGVTRPQSQNSGGYDGSVYQVPVIGAPLANGWNWQGRPGYVQSRAAEEDRERTAESGDDGGPDNGADANDDSDPESDMIDDSDDDLVSDEYDSDASQKSHNTRKNKNWFRKFFTSLEGLTIEQINDPERQWHCPACQGGPGSIDWYRGLQPLMTHAKTIGAQRVKLHREFAEILDEEVKRIGASVIAPGETFHKWKGLLDEDKDYEIVWPPMVVIMNTRLEQDDNDKWIGMGNAELLDYFKSFKPVKPRHSYGPQGHRGMSVLIFEASASGYLNAEYLHKHFVDQRTDRNAWESNRRALFYRGSGGNRQLYGYMAKKEDLEYFNQHSPGKTRLKYDMRSYQEMVVREARQLTEKSQQLNYYMDKAEREKRHSKAIEESFNIVSEKLRKQMEDIRIVRQRTKEQHEQNKEEMDYIEQFYKEKKKIIHEEMDNKEEIFEQQQQEKREMVKQSNANTLNAEENKHRVADIEKFIELQDKEMEEFVAEREKLTKEHEEKVKAMKMRHWEEEVELEKGFNDELTVLMEKYSAKDAAKGS